MRGPDTNPDAITYACGALYACPHGVPYPRSDTVAHGCPYCATDARAESDRDATARRAKSHARTLRARRRGMVG